MRILHVGYGFRPWRTGGLIEYAEDLLTAQTRAGHTVGYFLAGRQYRSLRRTRLKRWRKNGIPYFEVVDSPLFHGGDRGSDAPDLDIEELRTEALFRSIVSEFRPDVVHVQELSGLPSSLLSIAADEFSVPVVMTLQDYFPLCPTLKLWDTERSMCWRTEVGQDCVTCCAEAGRNAQVLQDATVSYEWNRYKELVPRPLVNVVKKLRPGAVQAMASPPFRAGSASVRELPPPVLASAADYQRRREINLERLRRVDLLIAQSHRVEEIYRQLGGASQNICTIQLTVKHLAELTPQQFPPIAGPVNFVTLNGCYNHLKGAHLLLDAMKRLHRDGLGEQFVLHSWGGLAPELEQSFRAFSNFQHGSWYRPQQLNSILNGMHVGVIPSTWEEAFGYVGLEYLAKGIPVLGNAKGGIVDYTREGVTGWLNHANTGEGLASIMARLIRHPQEILDRNRQIVAARATLVKTIEQHVEGMTDVYQQVIRTTRAGSSSRRTELRAAAGSAVGQG